MDESNWPYTLARGNERILFSFFFFEANPARSVWIMCDCCQSPSDFRFFLQILWNACHVWVVFNIDFRSTQSLQQAYTEYCLIVVDVANSFKSKGSYTSPGCSSSTCFPLLYPNLILLTLNGILPNLITSPSTTFTIPSSFTTLHK